MESKRIKLFDCARALCTIYIIGFWHLANYISINIDNDYSRQVTYGTLGCFLFISGYFLGGKSHKINSISEIGIFYRKRFFQIYPLFLVSCLSLYIANIIWGYEYIVSFKQLLLTLVGLSCIITPAPATIWFVSMLILFYAITPLISSIERKTIKTTASLLMMLIIYIIYKNTPFVDNRMCILSPCYFLALNMPENFVSNILKKPLYFIICFLSLLLIFTIGLFNVNEFFQMISILLMAYIILCAGAVLEKNKAILRVCLFISKGSMVSYLFHRQYFGLIKMFLGHNEGYLVYIVACIILFIISFFAQKYYELVIRRLKYS